MGCERTGGASTARGDLRRGDLHRGTSTGGPTVFQKRHVARQLHIAHARRRARRQLVHGTTHAARPVNMNPDDPLLPRRVKTVDAPYELRGKLWMVYTSTPLLFFSVVLFFAVWTALGFEGYLVRTKWLTSSISVLILWGVLYSSIVSSSDEWMFLHKKFEKRMHQKAGEGVEFTRNSISEWFKFNQQLLWRMANAVVDIVKLFFVALKMFVEEMMDSLLRFIGSLFKPLRELLALCLVLGGGAIDVVTDEMPKVVESIKPIPERARRVIRENVVGCIAVALVCAWLGPGDYLGYLRPRIRSLMGLH